MITYSCLQVRITLNIHTTLLLYFCLVCCLLLKKLEIPRPNFIYKMSVPDKEWRRCSLSVLFLYFTSRLYIGLHRLSIKFNSADMFKMYQAFFLLYTKLFCLSSKLGPRTSEPICFFFENILYVTRKEIFSTF